jgi:hypothetical protein
VFKKKKKMNKFGFLKSLLAGLLLISDMASSRPKKIRKILF